MEQRRTEGGSRTVTQEAAPILRLRNGQQQERPARTRPGVRWTEEVVDNEHMNKKKSKICCIFHPQREFGEESGDSSSDSSSDSSEDENEPKSNNKDQDHADHGDHCCDHGHGKVKKIKRKSKPNAYERQPKYTNESKAPPKE